MKIASLILVAGLTGCSLVALKPGSSLVSPNKTLLKQSENPKSESTQKYEKTTETVFVLPEDKPVQSKPAKITVTERVDTTIGAAQKDAAREIGAKLNAMRPIVWVGILLFVFGAASAFYPPLKLIVGSVTTSAVACAAGLVLIVLPSLVVGNEVLIMSVAGGVVAVWFFVHRHATVHSELKILKNGKDKKDVV